MWKGKLDSGFFLLLQIEKNIYEVYDLKKYIYFLIGLKASL